jgi:hypothetical protein
MHDGLGVDGLQSPPAGPRDRTGTAVRTEGEHLGADQLDLLAGPFAFRAHPQVALGGYGSEQIDEDAAQPGVVSRLEALQCTHQERRHRRAVLNRGRPGAAHHVGRDESFALRIRFVDEFVIGITHGRPAPGMSTVMESSRDSLVPTRR